MIATARPDRQAELETLRGILLADERDNIDTLRRALMSLDGRVGDDDRFQDTMTRSLVAAFRRAELTQHRELAEALSPLVLAGIRREIVESRDLMVEALYPITGRLVTAAVANAFRTLVAEVNARLEAAVTPNNWRRRAKSLLTGRPLADIILSETAGFRLERILLIDRASGALLGTWTAREEGMGNDSQTALMGGLLSAIVGFSRDAFEGDGHDLRALDLGDRVVMLRSSARRIVAAVGQGIVNGELEARTDRAFLNLLESGMSTDDAASSRALLASLASVIVPEAARAKPNPLPLLTVAALLVAALGYWGLRAYEVRRSEQRLDDALAGISESVGANGGALTLSRDAPHHRVRAVGFLPSEKMRGDLADAIGRELPGYRLDPHIVTATGGPASLDVTMKLVALGPDVSTRPELPPGSVAQTADRSEAAAGQTNGESLPYADRLGRLERAIAGMHIDTEGRLNSTSTGLTSASDRIGRLESAIAGIRIETEERLKTTSTVLATDSDRVDRLESAVTGLRLDTESRAKSTETLLRSELERLRASIEDAMSGVRGARQLLALTLSGYAVFFEQGSVYRSAADAERDLGTIAALLKDKPEPRIRLIGHGDDLGSRAANMTIARARADKVASDLVARGVDPARLVIAARDGSQEIVDTHGIGSPNRRVTFEPVYVGE
jgi:outer membrane protein OmpA-like peptidoglycan-associated protein